MKLDWQEFFRYYKRFSNFPHSDMKGFCHYYQDNCRFYMDEVVYKKENIIIKIKDKLIRKK